MIREIQLLHPMSSSDVRRKYGSRLVSMLLDEQGRVSAIRVREEKRVERFGYSAVESATLVVSRPKCEVLDADSDAQSPEE